MIRLLASVVFILAGFWPVYGCQTETPSPTPTPSPSSKKDNEGKVEQALEKIFRIKSHKASVSNPADFNTPGVLQVEYGYSGFYRGNSFRSQAAGTLGIVYAATERIGLEFDLDTVATQQDSLYLRMTGAGDSRLGVQIDIASASRQLPSLAISYFAKIPTASVSKNLGTGRVDHMVTAIFSKKIGKFNFDFNSGFLINGKQGEKGFVTGGQFAIGVGRDVTKKINLQAEIYGESKDADEPQGLFAAGIFDYQLNERISFNAGLKVGLSPDSPRLGVAAGFTYLLPSFFKKGK